MVPAAGIIVGLVLGLAAGGKPSNLLDLRIKWLFALLLAALLRFGLEFAVSQGIDVQDQVRALASAAGYGLLAAVLLRNRGLPGMTTAASGIIANGVAVVMNGGRMPVWLPSLDAAGLGRAGFDERLHSLLPAALDLGFFTRAGPLSDLIPLPLPLLSSVVSIGDLLLGTGLAFLAFAALIGARGQLALATPASIGGAPATRSQPLPRVLRHPYVRLAINGPFSALWVGQLISQFGDRVHQIALVFLVLAATHGSPLAVGLAFASSTFASLFVAPVAGAYVDRWDHRRVMVASDVLRAALVMTIPLVSSVNIYFVYPIVFAVAAVSTFFRPARIAILPRMVDDHELMTANSALWIGDTVTDVVGYPLAGLFVAFLGTALPLAFWLDGLSYLVSAALIATIAIPKLVAGVEQCHASVRSDIAEAWRYITKEAVLAATTFQAMAAEYGVGALTALSPLVVAHLAGSAAESRAAYGYLETALGIGALAGGVLIGALGRRVRLGPAIVVGFVLSGVAIVCVGASPFIPLVLIAAGAVGVSNVVFIVPSQTLFQERTPTQLLGRVVSIRSALVNGAVAIAMMTSGLLAEIFGVQTVLVACGAITVVAGASGLLVRAIRDA